MMIKAKDPVREAFAGCSTTGRAVDYYNYKADALRVFEAVLIAHGYCFDDTEFTNMSGDLGRATFRVLTGQGEYATQAVFTWYKMLSGRYEVVGYLA